MEASSLVVEKMKDGPVRRSACESKHTEEDDERTVDVTALAAQRIKNDLVQHLALEIVNAGTEAMAIAIL